jgi:hypothetical protein
MPDGSVVVKLSDEKGKPRLLMSVDAAGAPSISFFDEGEVTQEFPQ